MKRKSGWYLAIASGIVLVILSPAIIVGNGTLVAIVFIYPVGQLAAPRLYRNRHTLPFFP